LSGLQNHNQYQQQWCNIAFISLMQSDALSKSSIKMDPASITPQLQTKTLCFWMLESAD